MLEDTTIGHDETDGDRYDRAIAHLYAHPEELEESWRHPGDYKIAGCLFVNASKIMYSYRKVDPTHWLSDPISIKRSERFVSDIPEVTEMIRRDEQLPSSITDCTLQHLPRLAHWQRMIDRWTKRKWGESMIKDPEPTSAEDNESGAASDKAHEDDEADVEEAEQRISDPNDPVIPFGE